MKKLSAILVCLLMIITCSLAGCATFSINKVKYYNEVLAKVGDKNITRYDLLNAYSSYGESYYVQQMGQSESKALKNTLNLLIDRELLYQHALDNDNLYKPTAYQVNEVVKEMFESLDSQMESYIEKAKSVLNIEIDEEKEDEEEKEETAYKYEDYVYSPRATVKDKKVYYTDSTYETKSETETSFFKTEYYIEYITEKEETTYEKLIDERYLNHFTLKGVEKELKNKYFENFYNDLVKEENDNADAIYNKVRSYFAKDLISYEYYLRDENGKTYSKSTEDLLNRYFKRTFESQIQSQYLDNIRTYYLEHEELSISLLEKEYSYLSTVNYNLYSNAEYYKDKIKDIGTDGNSILYHPETDAEFGYFIHTLISFDSIKDNLELLKEELNEETYEQEYAKLINSIKVKARNAETGLTDEDATESTLAEIIEEYNSIQTNYATYEEKLSAFVQFMFKYTTDTATLSSGMPYVIGYNPLQYTGEEVDGKLEGTYSAMVTEFTKEAIALMKQNRGSMSTVAINDIDNMCITEYGIHLLFYVGDVNAYDIPYGETANIYIQNNDEENNPSKLHNLYTKIINPLTKETYFDKMFDLVYPAASGEVYTSKTGYTDYEKQLTQTSQQDNKVVKYTTKIKATKTRI